MYLPQHFAVNDPQTLYAYIDQRVVGTLVTHGEGGLAVGEVPLLLEPESGRLWGHLARVNPQLEDLASGGDVLVNFLGPSAYVSPNWYADHGQVPTWNFINVQVRGAPVLHDDRDTVLDIVQRLSAKQEAVFETPWTTDKMDPAMLDKMLRVIVGFSIEISDIQGKYKLSQNRNAEDRAGVMAGTRQQGNIGLADAMQALEEKNEAG